MNQINLIICLTFVVLLYIYIKTVIMSRKKLKPGELKVKLSIRIAPELYSVIKSESNISKYIEKLIETNVNNKLLK